MSVVLKCVLPFFEHCHQTLRRMAGNFNTSMTRRLGSNLCHSSSINRKKKSAQKQGFKRQQTACCISCPLTIQDPINLDDLNWSKVKIYTGSFEPVHLNERLHSRMTWASPTPVETATPSAFKPGGAIDMIHVNSWFNHGKMPNNTRILQNKELH